MRRPAYTRLQVDERRRQLLERAAELYVQQGYDQLSMSRIAREAGISKALLYHYFPSKRAYFVATIEQAADELRRRTEPDPALPAGEQLVRSLEAFLELVEENSAAYGKLMQSATSVADVRELIDEVRAHTAQRILAGVAPEGASPALRAAVNGWLWFMDGVCLDWIERRDLDRTQVRDLLLGTLFGALSIADPEAASAAAATS